MMVGFNNPILCKQVYFLKLLLMEVDIDIIHI